MFLITEARLDGIKLLKEAREDGTPEYFIEGIFMQSEKKNKNGRNYPKDILVKEVKRYGDEYVTKKRALGELGHPEGPTVNLERVSHMITDLWEDGNDVYGRAKILQETPMGNIVKNLIDEGVSVGVSSRGMGSLKKNKKGVNEVQDDFMLSAIDIVSDPSAPDAFVNGIMEGKEWVWDNGILKSYDVERHKKIIESATNKKDRENNILYAFVDFLSKV
tara:strand:- start:1753 stop:2409 length:657 start_codon:yes stop_codon:yes gene_type:complete